MEVSEGDTEAEDSQLETSTLDVSQISEVSHRPGVRGGSSSFNLRVFVIAKIEQQFKSEQCQ